MREVLVVDDEATIRLGLMTFIRQLNGFSVAAECKNGLEALQSISRLKPDIVITDIKMPRMDGIALMKECAQLENPPKFIILSGYGEFEYAKEAIRAGAYDYILKPVDHDNLEKVLTSLIGLLADEDKKKQMIRQQTGIQLINGSPEPIPGAYGGLLYTAAVIDADTYVPDREGGAEPPGPSVVQLAGMASAFFAKMKNDETIVFPYDGKAVAIFAEPYKLKETNREANRAVETLLRKFIDSANTQNVRLFCGLGHTSADLAEVQESYREALSAIRYYLCEYEACSVFCFAQTGRPGYRNTGQYLRHLKEIAGTVMSAGDMPQRDCLDGVFAEMISEKCHPDCILDICKEFILSTLESSGYSVDHPLEMLAGCKTCREISHRLWGFLLECRKFLKEKSEKQFGFIVGDAVKYLNQNYADNKLSLKSACQAYHVDASHFCRLFKAKTGKTFNEYLTCIRMEKAMDLMVRADMKIYEIAGQSGFSDVQYFCRIFKKYAGCTPQEFRDRCL